MKRILLLSLLFVSATPKVERSSSALTNGVAAYVQNPLDIAVGGEVAFDYVTKVRLTVTYSYIVADGNNNIIKEVNDVTRVLSANSTISITYFAPPYTFTVGSNRILFTFKTSVDANTRTHNLFFYGYERAKTINLNNSTATYDAFYNEIQFIYNGYEAGTVVYKRTSFRTSHLDGTIYFPTDFYFDFNELYFYATGNYPSTFYTEALLFFKDYTLFPNLSRVRGEAVLELKLIKTGNDISFSPLRQLYLDPTTLRVRSEYRAGHVPVDKLYFPRDAYGRTDLAMCRLEIAQFGFHKFNLVYNFHLEIGMPFLGQGGLHEVIIIRG